MPQVVLDARDVPVTGDDGVEAAVPDTAAAAAAGGGGAAGATEVLRAGSLRDPWSVVEPPPPVFVRDPAPGPAHDPAHDPVHDPDEVTVQNDVGVVRIHPTGPTRLIPPVPGVRPGAAEDADASDTSETSDATRASDGLVPVPVFVDASGRRSRRFRRLGTALGLVCAVYAVVIVITLLSGSSDAPWLPVPGQNHDRPAGKVGDSPRPARTPRSSDDGASVAGPAVSGATTPPAAAASRAPGTGKGTARPSPSASAHPSSSSGVTLSSPEPGSPSASAVPSSAAPSPDAPASPASSPPASPSESAAPTGGPVAQGAAPRTATGTGTTGGAPAAAPVL
ncbi:hypothetical protein OHB00_20845 [Streptomyces sp. NBC_00631]|uniref:hypothetical protein n=1 Tax=Streptomyces sp. NBC_00631 TaxID=2975793 RepID=UPI0030DFF468